MRLMILCFTEFLTDMEIQCFKCFYSHENILCNSLLLLLLPALLLRELFLCGNTSYYAWIPVCAFTNNKHNLIFQRCTILLINNYVYKKIFLFFSEVDRCRIIVLTIDTCGHGFVVYVMQGCVRSHYCSNPALSTAADKAS